MSKAIHIIIFIGLLCYAGLINAQKLDPDKIIEAIIESQLDRIEEDADISLIIEDLEELAENPLNINATNSSELSKLYLLNEVQINKLLKYIEEFGPAYSIFELKTIDGLTPEILQKMQYFIWFGPPKEETKTLKEDLQYSKHQLLIRSLGTLQKQKGYKEKDDGTIPYEGNRFRYYTRYHFEAGDKISAGFTAEKDPGEAFFSGSNKQGFDFYSGHINVNLNNVFEQVTFGDFLIRSGQGLVLWQGYSSGKSENALGVSKTGQGVRPSTSVDENLFFRGGATSVNIGFGKLIFFLSQKKDDANLTLDDAGKTYFTSLQTSGYHRTQSEIDDKNSIRNRNTGAVFSTNFNNLKIGATFLHQQFEAPFIKADKLYNLYSFTGISNYNFGVDYTFCKGGYQLFGEAAISKSKGKAIIQGAVVHLNDQLNLAVLYRHFDKNYHAFWANTFAEGSNTTNESGFYLGAKFLPAKYVTLSAYSDIYNSDWLSYTTAAPANNWDIFAQADFRISENFSFYMRYKNEEKELKNKSNGLYINLKERTQKMRFHLTFQPAENLKFKTRFEHSYFEGDQNEKGYLIFQDVQFTANNFPFSLTTRFAYFNTDNWDSRIYAYENDLLYTFSIPAFYGKGIRTYVNSKLKISDKIECWLKFANTHYTDRETISSGYYEIEGSYKTELKFQLRLKF